MHRGSNCINPLNRKLIFQGTLDETGAGDPFLLLRLDESERVRLKQLDGGDGSEASDYEEVATAWRRTAPGTRRSSRSPSDAQSEAARPRPRGGSLHSGSYDPTTGLTVPEVHEHVARWRDVDNALLLGMQDQDGDGVPEPLQVVGFTPALTAGFAEGTGFVTLAFNNEQHQSEPSK